jgi:hypothetical protein
VGCNLVHAGSHPLNMNMGPSLASLSHSLATSPVTSTPVVHGSTTSGSGGTETIVLGRRFVTHEVLITAMVLVEPGPCAFMILDLSTSAGEQTVVATVP